jgi:PAS domain S-box-containing protein
MRSVAANVHPADERAPMDRLRESELPADGEPLEDRLRLLTAQLAETELQLKAMLEHSNDAIIVLDKQRNIVRINGPAIQLFDLMGATRWDDRVGEAYEICMPTGVRLPFEEWPASIAVNGHFVQSYKLLIRRNATGQIVPSEVSSAPILNASGEPVQFFICHRDIAERDQGKARLAAIVDSSEDAIIGTDNRGYITSWNAGAEKIFGYNSSQVNGRSITLLLPAELGQEGDEILRRIKSGEIVQHIETKRKRRDGSVIDVSLTISPIKAMDGTIVGASRIARDITEQRRIEHHAQQSQKLEAIGQLTGAIAHDFNNLLGVIVGNLDLLERLVPHDPSALKRVHTAQRAATRGSGLTQRLLAFSREDELRPESTSLNEAVHKVIAQASQDLPSTITIATNLDRSLQPVFVDAAGLESALLSLVLNAQDAMPNGGSLSITTESRNFEDSYAQVQSGEIKAGRYGSVSVSDSGHGMSGEVLTRALEPFFTTKERHKGSGLGLAMVYGFVKQSGGSIRIYSETGLGTTATFYLPFSDRRARPVSSSVEEKQSPESVVSVLVVDDEIDLLDIAVAYLKDMGYSTFEAVDGATAFEIIMNHREIGLVITDIIMPGGMNGVELVRKIRQLRPEIKIVYCSGFPAGALAGKAAPPIDGPLLHKPYHRADFDIVVRSVLSGRVN